MSLIGFARVSTSQQDLSIQLDALKEAGCEVIFHGKQSGASDENEAKLAEMINYVRRGDLILVTKLDRLGRSLKSVLATIDSLHEKGATIKSMDGVIDTSNKSPFGKAMLNLIATFAQLERDLIVSRTQEGREAAIKAGKRVGRLKTIALCDRKRIQQQLLTGNSSVSSLATFYKVSRTTIRRIKNERL